MNLFKNFYKKIMIMGLTLGIGVSLYSIGAYAAVKNSDTVVNSGSSVKNIKMYEEALKNREVIYVSENKNSVIGTYLSIYSDDTYKLSSELNFGFIQKEIASSPSLDNTIMTTMSWRKDNGTNDYYGNSKLIENYNYNDIADKITFYGIKDGYGYKEGKESFSNSNLDVDFVINGIKNTIKNYYLVLEFNPTKTGTSAEPNYKVYEFNIVDFKIYPNNYTSETIVSQNIIKQTCPWYGENLSKTEIFNKYKGTQYFKKDWVNNITGKDILESDIIKNRDILSDSEYLKKLNSTFNLSDNVSTNIPKNISGFNQIGYNIDYENYLTSKWEISATENGTYESLGNSNDKKIKYNPIDQNFTIGDVTVALPDKYKNADSFYIRRVSSADGIEPTYKNSVSPSMRIIVKKIPTITKIDAKYKGNSLVGSTIDKSNIEITCTYSDGQVKKYNGKDLDTSITIDKSEVNEGSNTINYTFYDPTYGEIKTGNIVFSSSKTPLEIMQPLSRDFGKINKSDKININNKAGFLAYIPGTTSATLEMSTDEQNWKTSSIQLTVSNGVITAAVTTGSSDIINKYLRIKTDGDVYSTSFTVAASNSSEKAPEPINQMSKDDVYVYTADDTIVLSPNLIEHGYTPNYKVEWFKSTDEGKTFEKLYEGLTKDNPSMSYTMEATTDLTYSQYKYRITNEAGYVESKPFEIIVYERYNYKNGTLTIESAGDQAGDGAKMNDYRIGSRLDGLRPWDKYKDQAKRLEINDKVQSIGDDAFSDFTKVVNMDLGKVETVGLRAFKNNTSLRGVTFPAETIMIKDDALMNDEALLDIRFYNPDTVISSVFTTIPESKEEPSDIKASSENEDKVKNQHSYPVIYGFRGKALDREHGINSAVAGGAVYEWAKSKNRVFIPIDAIDSDDTGYPLYWNYTVNNGEITNLQLTDSSKANILGDDKSLKVYIPKSIDGYKVTSLAGKHIEGSDNTAEEFIDIFGISSEDDNTTHINELHIPETINTISEDAFYNISKINTIYNYNRNNMKASGSFFGSGSSSTIWTYSTNKVFRNASKGSFEYSFLFDSDKLSGITGDLKWEINLADGSITLSGTGNSDNYDKESDIPFIWAKEDITEIIIKPGVKGLGKNLYSGLTKVISIQNLSEVLTNIHETSFNNVGKDIKKTKKIKTYVNNLFYDRMEELKNQTSATMNYNFMTTTAGLGTGVQFTYDAADLSLTIKGTGSTNTYSDPKDVPWRCVNQYIKTINIENGIKGLSNNLFNGLVNLKKVYNYGKGQQILGGNDNLFDVIDRKTEESVLTNYITIDIPEADENDPNYQKEYVNTQLNKNGINIKLADKIKRGTYVIKKDLSEKNINEIFEGKKNDYSSEKNGIFETYGLVELKVPEANQNIPELQMETITTQARRLKIDLEESDLTGKALVAGTYVFKQSALTDDIVSILTGEKQDSVHEKYIVPVYTFGLDDNKDFVDAVPQPEEKGYRLENIYIDKGQAGDNLYWYISLDNVLMFEGYGDMWDFNMESAPWFKYAKQIKDIQFAEKMTSIGNFAFEDFELLTEVSDIPITVSRVGIGAFKDSINLYNFSIKATMTDFNSGVFAGCTGLRVLMIEDTSRYTLEDGVLYNKDNTILGYLRETLYTDVENKETADYIEEYTIKDGVKAIGELSFYGIQSINKLTISGTVSDIKMMGLAEMSNLRDIQNDYKGKQTISGDILSNSGKNFQDIKFTVLWKANTDFKTVAQREGYIIRYYDETKVNKVIAVYDGDPVTIGRTFLRDDVTISILYDSGESTTINGTDQRITFNDLVVKNIGPNNKFTATYNDGFGQVLTSNEFVIEGVNAITAVEFKYNGTTVWYGESFDPSNVNATLTYADGTTKTIKGNATYTTDSGEIPYITYDKMVIDKVGKDNEITATYKDKSNGPISGKFNVTGRNYLKDITATYKGDPVELSEGTKGLELDRLLVTMTWADGTVENISADDGRIDISSDYYISGDNVIFELTCVEDNRYDLVAAFAVKFLSNVTNVEFEYVGQPVTRGMKYSMSDIELTLSFVNGTVKKVRGDTVTGLTADVYVVNTSDDLQPVNLTYTTGGSEFKGTVYIPGRIKTPLKLIVVQRPKKSVYQEGERFEPEGMIINCLFDNGDIEDVTDKISIENGEIMSASSKFITIVYHDTASNSTVKTNMAINVNQNQKEITQSKEFKEQYEITKILFRSKQTEDETYGKDDEDTGVGTGGSTGTTEDEEENGKWIDITPPGNKNIYDKNSEVQATIKAGYGFEIKVFTRYRTNRAGEEFSQFMKRELWDQQYVNEGKITNDEINSRWKYLNDVYPQYTPTANPDILYLRIQNGNLQDEDGNKLNTSLNTGVNGSQDFIVLEKTNVSEDGNVVDEGEWYNSEKIFEFPERDVFGTGNKTRRVYLSRDAADPNAAYTDYQIQIISPAWYGYEPEPVFEDGEFKHINEPGQELRQKAWSVPGTPYLHVCASFTIRVTTNDDIHTHILQ